MTPFPSPGAGARRICFSPHPGCVPLRAIALRRLSVQRDRRRCCRGAEVDAKRAKLVYLRKRRRSRSRPTAARIVWHEIQEHCHTTASTRRAPSSRHGPPWYDEKPAIARADRERRNGPHPRPESDRGGESEEEQDIFRTPAAGATPGVAAARSSDGDHDGRTQPIAAAAPPRYHFGRESTWSNASHLDSVAGVTPRIVTAPAAAAHVVENAARASFFEQGHTTASRRRRATSLRRVERGPTSPFRAVTSWQEIAKNYSRIVDQQNRQRGPEGRRGRAWQGNRPPRDRRQAARRRQPRRSHAGVEVGEGSIVPRSPKSVLQRSTATARTKRRCWWRCCARPAFRPRGPARVEHRLDTWPICPAYALQSRHRVVDGQPALW